MVLKSLVVAVLALFATSAMAADKPTLTVYTYQSFASDYGPGTAIKQGFEASCACTLAYVPVDSAIAALRRIQLEGQTTSADVLLQVQPPPLRLNQDAGIDEDRHGSWTSTRASASRAAVRSSASCAASVGERCGSAATNAGRSASRVPTGRGRSSAMGLLPRTKIKHSPR